MNIGLIGLGLLGRAMAERFLAEGHTVYGHDIAPAANEEAKTLGVEVLSDAKNIPDKTNLIFLSLMTSQDRRDLLWGEQGLAASLRKDNLLLDTTTAKPGDIVEDHARLSEQGVRLVDVCVSGSSRTVRDRQALALVGDTREGAEPYAGILECFTKQRYYFDHPGRGNSAKLVVNVVMGLNRLVLAEGLALARKADFDLGTILEVLKEGDTYSKSMDTKGPKMVSGEYEPAAARLEQHAKDVNLILEYAANLDADLPVSRLHRQILDKALEEGAGPLDNAAIFKAYS